MNNLKTILSAVSTSSSITINTSTTMKLNKTYKDDEGEKFPNPHHNLVSKLMTGAQIAVSTDYETEVKARLVSEGKDPDSFTLSKRSWGTRISDSCFIEHKGEYYLECIFEQAGESHYEMNGTVINFSDILGKPATRPKPESQGGLEKKVVIRTFKLSSLTSITIDGTEYTNLVYMD